MDKGGYRGKPKIGLLKDAIDSMPVRDMAAERRDIAAEVGAGKYLWLQPTHMCIYSVYMQVEMLYSS